MKSKKNYRKNIHAYSRKKGNLKIRLEKEFIDHGIVTIPCKVSDFNDIISPYSVEGYESLDSSFVEYINGIAEIVPEKYPIVLSIVGHKFTKEEQKIIKCTIEDDFAYDLGFVEEENKHHLKVFLGMIVGLILTGVMITFFDWWAMMPLELLFVFFWFFADTFVDYLLIEGRHLRKKRLKAAQLTCVKVEFSEEYDERDYSEEEAQKIFNRLSEKTEK